jgi:hypothetical protein
MFPEARLPPIHGTMSISNKRTVGLVVLAASRDDRASLEKPESSGHHWEPWSASYSCHGSSGKRARFYGNTSITSIAEFLKVSLV